MEAGLITTLIIGIIFGLGYLALAIFILVKSAKTKDVEYSIGWIIVCALLGGLLSLIVYLVVVNNNKEKARNNTQVPPVQTPPTV